MVMAGTVMTGSARSGLQEHVGRIEGVAAAPKFRAETDKWIGQRFLDAIPD
jgi:hypothetical protein